MTTVGNRKGFKFTKISNTTAVTETLAFDEIEKESTIQPIVGSKRLRSKVAAVNSNDAINESNKTSPSSNSSKNNQSVSPTKSTKSKSSKDEIIRLNEEISAKSQVKESLEKSINEEDNQESKKTYYPTIPYNPSGKLRSKSNKNHIELLKHLIAEVCTAESDGLKNFFQSSFKGKNRKAIEPILLDILSQIPTAVMDECSDDLTFQPEFSQIEKQRIDKLSSMQQKLEEYHELLLRYENDINLFAKDFDLWIADVPQKSSSKNFQLSVCYMFYEIYISLL